MNIGPNKDRDDEQNIAFNPIIFTKISGVLVSRFVCNEASI